MGRRNRQGTRPKYLKQLKAKKGKDMARNPLKSELDEIKALRRKKDKLNIKLKVAEAKAAVALNEFIDSLDDLRESCSIENQNAQLDSVEGVKWIVRVQMPNGQVREVPLIEEDKKLKVVEQPKEEIKAGEKAAN
jgi:hypothetical protein